MVTRSTINRLSSQIEELEERLGLAPRIEYEVLLLFGGEGPPQTHAWRHNAIRLAFGEVPRNSNAFLNLSRAHAWHQRLQMAHLSFVGTGTQQTQAVSVATRKRKRPISLARVSFLDNEKAEPEATKNDSWMGCGMGKISSDPQKASNYGLFFITPGG